FFGLYEPATNVLRFVNCGHPSPVLLRANGAAELLAPTAMVLGAFENAIVEEGATPLLAGDRLLVFSDGFAEAGLSAGADNDDWALDTIRLLTRTRCERLAGRLAAAATAAGKQADDITVMEVRLARI
ncbi:MAG: PP2C family protein-serine/threonine phosphatase, partial [Bryobacteraceae bacterium]